MSGENDNDRGAADDITNSQITDSSESAEAVVQKHSNLVEVPLNDDNSTVEPSLEPESKTETSEQVATIPAKRRGSIELQKIEVVSSKSAEVAASEVPPKPPRHSYPSPEVIYAPERFSNIMGCLKCLLMIITSALMLLGVAIIAVAGWLKADPDFWNIQTGLDLGQFASSANIAIAAGVAILLIGVIGFCGAIRESTCMLMVYFIIALILVILEAAVVGVVWSATYNPETRDKVGEILQKGIDDMEKYHEKTVKNLINIIQEKLECCGVRGPQDYLPEKGLPPRSCFDRNMLVYSEGCLDKLFNYLKSKAALIGGIAIAALLLQVGGLVIDICLFCAVRQGNSKVF